MTAEVVEQVVIDHQYPANRQAAVRLLNPHLY
jgi:hypothetical protein